MQDGEARSRLHPGQDRRCHRAARAGGLLCPCLAGYVPQSSAALPVEQPRTGRRGWFGVSPASACPRATVTRLQLQDCNTRMYPPHCRTAWVTTPRVPHSLASISRSFAQISIDNFNTTPVEKHLPVYVIPNHQVAHL